MQDSNWITWQTDRDWEIAHSLNAQHGEKGNKTQGNSVRHYNGFRGSKERMQKKVEASQGNNLQNETEVL